MEAARLAEHCERLFALDTVKLSQSYYYASLPLCVIDAVFSIGVKYTGVQNTVRRYCRHFGLREYDPERDISGDIHTVSPQRLASWFPCAVSASTPTSI